MSDLTQRDYENLGIDPMAYEKMLEEKISRQNVEIARVQSLHEGLMKNADKMNDELRAEIATLKAQVAAFEKLEDENRFKNAAAVALHILETAFNDSVRQFNDALEAATTGTASGPWGATPPSPAPHRPPSST